MTPPHPDAERRILEAIPALTRRLGYPPTYREIAAETFYSVASIYGTLIRLRNQGRVTWQDGRARTLVVIDDREGPVTLVTIGKEFRFEASHVLENHDGKCARLHGHSYRVVVELAGRVRIAPGAADEGMVMDFARVKDAWTNRCHARLDHRHLNDVEGFDEIGPTTAENICVWIMRALTEALPLLSAVTVWETATSFARVEREPGS